MGEGSAAQASGDSPQYLTEKNRILRRRQALSLDTRPEKTVGLALSGGGIRSATFSLGLIQAMAKTHPKGVDSQEDTVALKLVDLLSTVSGGGYVGMFLGGLSMPRRSDKTIPDPVDKTGNEAQDDPKAALDRAIQILSTTANTPNVDLNPAQPPATEDRSTIFHPLRWLRENGRYLTPGGSGDVLYLTAFYLRSIIGVQYVFALGLFLLVLVLLPLREATLGLLSHLAKLFGHADQWADRLRWCEDTCGSTFAFWWSPIFIWPVVLIFLVGGPLVLGYWVTYRQERRGVLSKSFEEWSIEAGPVLASIAAATVIYTFSDGLKGDPLLVLLVYGIYLALVAFVIRNFFVPFGLTQDSSDSGNWKSDSGKVAEARLILTRALSWVLKWTCFLAVAALVDSIGQSLFGWLFGAGTEKWTKFTFGTGFIGIVAILFRKLSLMAGDQSSKGWLGVVLRYRQAAATVTGIIIVFGSAIALFVLLQAMLHGAAIEAGRQIDGTDRLDWGRFVAIAIGWALLFMMTWLSEGFLNNSTYHRFYAARLIRTFLGAANYVRMGELAGALKARQEAEVRNLFVSESHRDDDISLRSYFRTDSYGSLGPLHLINVTINESLSLTSSLVREDRKSVPLCVGPAGICAGTEFFSWNDALGDIGSRITVPKSQPDASAVDAVERLSLGTWCAVSGAAASTGMGRLSGTGYSMLAWLFNARLGYWWRAPKSMSTQGRHSPWRTFDLVLQEFFARFYGRRGVLWNLSDGGHFENTGMYELIRRRVPFIICADNGADPDYEFEDLENLIRRARIDFGAEVRIFGRTELDDVVKSAFALNEMAFFGTIGAIEEFRTVDNRRKYCMLLGKVEYPPESGAGASLLLIIKPSVVDFAPEDVRLYGKKNSTFPQQTTADQFFDEAQWESYRRLGESIGAQVFARWKSFRDLQRTI